MGIPSGPLRSHPAVAALVTGVLAVLAGLLPLGASPTGSAPALHVYNLAPAFGDPRNDEIWDPNFIPGFNGTPGVSINWSAPLGGPGVLSYYVGPWANGSVASYPHFVVGPQAFNFVEVPRTQVFRSPHWGDYEQVRQGFLSCAVNLGNYTVNTSAALHPIYIGMPESGVDWSVRLSIHWNPAVQTPGVPADARFELVTTTTLPALGPYSYPRLVYTEMVLWSTDGLVTALGGGAAPAVHPASDVAGDSTFTLDQLPNAAVDRSYDVPVSTFISSTLSSLGLPAGGALLSYVYLSAAGYNTHISASINGLWLGAPQQLC